jgi:hypothetical protein
MYTDFQHVFEIIYTTISVLYDAFTSYYILNIFLQEATCLEHKLAKLKVKNVLSFTFILHAFTVRFNF